MFGKQICRLRVLSHAMLTIDCKPGQPRTLFLLSVSSKSPKPVSVEGVSLLDEFGGWVCGYQKCSSIILIFKYSNKQDALI